MIDYTFTYSDLEYFLLVFTRISCFIFAAPFFSTNNTPRTVRAGLSFFIALVIYHAITPHVMPEYTTVLGYAALVLKEGITGLLIGLGANICNSIVLFAGKIADMEIGLSMVQLMDPLTKEATGFTGSLYQYAVMLLLMVTGMHHYLLRAIVETYTLIPIGGAVFQSDRIVTTMIQFLTDYVMIAFRICLPIVAAMMILNAVLGILAKTSPQINMFSVGIQIKILVGLSVLFLTISVLPGASEYIFKEMKIMITAMVKSMTL